MEGEIFHPYGCELRWVCSGMQRGHEAVESLVVAMIGNVRPGSRRRKDGGRREPLPVGVLDDDAAAGPQQAPRRLLDEAYQVEPVGAGEQRDLRVMAADFDVEVSQFPGGDVRGIADDEVKCAGVIGKGVARVGEVKRHVDSGARDIALCPATGVGIDLDGMHLGPRSSVGDGECDSAGPRAQVDDPRARYPRSPEVCQPVDRPLHDALGFGLWNENARADLKPKAPEFDLAGQVGQWLALTPALHQLEEAFLVTPVPGDRAQERLDVGLSRSDSGRA
jgi:hypothetical protein